MQDMYGLLLILGLLIVISRCVGKEKEAFENTTKYIKADEKLVKKATQRPVQQEKRNVFSYFPDEILLADANSPYGSNVPQSMMNEINMINQMGMTKNSLDAISQNGVQAGPARFNPTSSQSAGFDPSSKGGLLRGQIGQHVQKANQAVHDVERNISNSNSNNIVPSNSNENDYHKAEVTTNRQNHDNSLIQSNSIGMEGNSNGKGKLNIFMIHTNWCPHSVNALPGFKAFMSKNQGKSVNGYTLNIQEFDVASDNHKKEKEMFKVRGYPSVIAIKGDDMSNYADVGGRDEKSIMKWINNN